MELPTGSSSVTETTSVSWLSRVMRSLVGVIFGILLVLVMIGVLFWNEGRAVTTASSLAEGSGAVVSVDQTDINGANEGKLVYTSGDLKVSDNLVDPTFGITADGVRLVRTVEMFQWTEASKSESRTKLGGAEETVTTYTYSRDWSSEEIDSSEFHNPAGHENPGMAVRGTSIQVPSAKLGAYTLNENILSDVSGGEPLPVTDAQKAAVLAALGETARPVHISFGKIVIADDVNTPKLGDIRVAFELIPAGPLSIVAAQTGSSFSAYQTQAGDQLQLVETGIVPVAKMFDNAVSENILITWLVRGAGLGLLMIGFALIFAPMSVVADVIPFVGALIGLGTGLIAFVCAMLVGSATIALAWFLYRPLLALAILGIGVAIAFAVGLLMRSRGKQTAPQAAPATPV